MIDCVPYQFLIPVVHGQIDIYCHMGKTLFPYNFYRVSSQPQKIHLYMEWIDEYDLSNLDETKFIPLKLMFMIQHQMFEDMSNQRQWQIDALIWTIMELFIIDSSKASHLQLSRNGSRSNFINIGGRSWEGISFSVWKGLHQTFGWFIQIGLGETLNTFYHWNSFTIYYHPYPLVKIKQSLFVLLDEFPHHFLPSLFTHQKAFILKQI